MEETIDIVSSFEEWLVKPILSALNKEGIAYSIQGCDGGSNILVPSDRVLEAQQICWDIEVALVAERRNAINDALSLDKLIKIKAPSYWVRYNPEIFLMDEAVPGAFEIGRDNGVHYRRKTVEEVEGLIFHESR